MKRDRKPARSNPVLKKPDKVLVEEAHEAGLTYGSDDKPGITRKLRGKNFVYLDREGKRVSDPKILGRIKRLAIPPAWTEVWIASSENNHLQATGRDARGRKQYRYHPYWREQRDESKFHRMIAFGRALPKIRNRVRRNLQLPGIPREKVLATVVKLLESTLIRVGNEEYARDNKSYGLTTMKNRHVKVAGEKIKFMFRGKSGKYHEISVRDRKLASIVRKCQDLPGQELFEYQNGDGQLHTVTSQDVNDYLREITDDDFTAKDFRTWAGTVLAALALREFEKVAGPAEAKKNVLTAIEAVSRMLGNTPSVCRKCYIHPRVLDSYMEGETIDTLQQRMSSRISHSLSRLKPEEAAVLVLLRKGLKKE